MNFWIDAQLPPILASWLTETFGLSATSLRDLGLRDASLRSHHCLSCFRHVTACTVEAELALCCLLFVLLAARCV